MLLYFMIRLVSFGCKAKRYREDKKDLKYSKFLQLNLKYLFALKSKLTCTNAECAMCFYADFE